MEGICYGKSTEYKNEELKKTAKDTKSETSVLVGKDTFC